MMNIRQPKLGLILMGIGIALVAVGVYELGQSDEFRSAARIKLLLSCGCLEEGSAKREDYHAEFIQHQVRDICSDVVLSNVVFRLELREKWAKKWAKKYVGEGRLPVEQAGKYLHNNEKIKTAEVVAMLKDRLEVIRVPNTPLLDIVFLGDDPDETALIANTITAVYLDWQAEQSRRLDQGGIAALKHKLVLEDQRARDLSNKVAATEVLLDQKSVERMAKVEKSAASLTEEERREVQQILTAQRPFWDAKRELDRQNDLRDLITRKITFEEVDLRLPRHSHVDVIESAVPAKSPIRRHRPLGAALSLVGLALFGYGIATVWKSRPPRLPISSV